MYAFIWKLISRFILKYGLKPILQNFSLTCKQIFVLKFNWKRRARNFALKYIDKVTQIHARMDKKTIILPKIYPGFFIFRISTCPWGIDGCVYRIWRKREDMFIVSRRGKKNEGWLGEKKAEGNKRQQKWRGKKDRWKVEIQRSKEAEKCSAVLVDRHALKKITVSSGILEEKEQAGE